MIRTGGGLEAAPGGGAYGGGLPEGGAPGGGAYGGGLPEGGVPGGGGDSRTIGPTAGVGNVGQNAFCTVTWSWLLMASSIPIPASALSSPKRPPNGKVESLSFVYAITDSNWVLKME